MKPSRTSLYIINFILLSAFLSAQETETESVNDSLTVDVKPKIKKPIDMALRFGLDLYKPVFSLTTTDYNGLELVGDLFVGNDFYIALELGNEEKTQQSENINFTTSGTYFKVGFDYNMFENWEGMNNQVYVGLRFGKSIHKQNVNHYRRYTTTHYWPEGIVDNDYAIGERTGLASNWIEVVAGIKVQTFNNFYMGFSLRLNRLLSDEKPDNFDNLHIPGFNRKTDDNIWGAGFNYTLTYSIPFRFKKPNKEIGADSVDLVTETLAKTNDVGSKN